MVGVGLYISVSARGPHKMVWLAVVRPALNFSTTFQSPPKTTSCLQKLERVKSRLSKKLE